MVHLTGFYIDVYNSISPSISHTLEQFAHLFIDMILVFACGQVHDSGVDRVSHQTESKERDDHQEEPHDVPTRQDGGEEEHTRQHLGERDGHVEAQHQVETVAHGEREVTSLKHSTRRHGNNDTEITFYYSVNE